MKVRDYIITILFGILVVIIIAKIMSLSCVFRAVLGIPCPGCGLTRAYRSFLRGDINLALRYHPLFWTVPFLGLPLVNIRKYKHLSDVIFVITIVLFLMVWLYRIWNLDNFLFL